MNKVLLSLSIVAAFTACKQSQQKNETETPLLLSPNTAYQNSSLTDTALKKQQLFTAMRRKNRLNPLSPFLNPSPRLQQTLVHQKQKILPSPEAQPLLKREIPMAS